MHDFQQLHETLIVGALVSVLGLLGVIVGRNLFHSLLAVAVAMLGALLSLAGWSEFHGDWIGPVWGTLIVALTMAELSIGFGLVKSLQPERAPAEHVSDGTAGIERSPLQSAQVDSSQSAASDVPDDLTATEDPI